LKQKGSCKKGFFFKRKGTRKNGAYLILYLMRISELVLHVPSTKNQKVLGKKVMVFA
jgi:hypothetical protein